MQFHQKITIAYTLSLIYYAVSRFSTLSHLFFSLFHFRLLLFCPEKSFSLFMSFLFCAFYSHVIFFPSFFSFSLFLFSLHSGFDSRLLWWVLIDTIYSTIDNLNPFSFFPFPFSLRLLCCVIQQRLSYHYGVLPRSIAFCVPPSSAVLHKSEMNEQHDGRTEICFAYKYCLPYCTVLYCIQPSMRTDSPRMVSCCVLRLSPSPRTVL